MNAIAAPAPPAASLIDPGCSLGALVAARPVPAQLFDQLRLEYCCGGDQTLAEACAGRGLGLDAIRAMLAALDATTIENPSPGVEDTDWREVGAALLCAHIVAVHHDGLREAFPRLQRLLTTVVRVHADTVPRLRDAERAFAEIRRELEPHLASEEDELSPACLAAERTGTPVDERIVAKHASEHAVLGHALAALRILCDDYDRRSALCDTHRTLLDELEAFERDLHRPRPRGEQHPAGPGVTGGLLFQGDL